MTTLARRARAAAAIAVAAWLAACTRGPADAAELAGFRALRGRLVSSDTGAARPRGRYAQQRVRLGSSDGLAATGWVIHPVPDRGPYPAVLLQDGREENADVVTRLPAEFGDVVVLALDYPAEIPYTVSLHDALWHGGRLRAAGRRIPALFSLGAAYLARRADVDSGRIAIAATSFAVPFATIAAATDQRFHDVALIYGAGDLPAVVAANLDLRPRWLRGPAAWLATRPIAELSPERFIAAIAPRPIVMVNGIDDPQMPAEAVRRLYDAAREPKKQIWLRTGHLMPTDSALIRALIDTAFAEVPVLRGARGRTAATVSTGAPASPR